MKVFYTCVTEPSGFGDPEVKLHPDAEDAYDHSAEMLTMYGYTDMLAPALAEIGRWRSRDFDTPELMFQMDEEMVLVVGWQEVES